MTRTLYGSLVFSLATATLAPSLGAEPSFAGSRTDPTREVNARRYVVVDSDDDDDDGIADWNDASLGDAALARLLWLPRAELDKSARAPEGAPLRFVDRKGVQLPAGKAPRGDRIGIQGVRPGSAGLRLTSGLSPVAVLEMTALDYKGRPVDLARSHASLSRVLPEGLGQEDSDTDALRWVVIGAPEDLPREIAVVSYGPDGKQVDSVGPVRLTSTPCPPGTNPELSCRTSPFIRASTDIVDRGHPAAADRSVLAEVGGRLRVEVMGGAGVSIRVGGPQGLPSMKVGRYRATLRAHVLRASKKGKPAVGTSDADARRILQEEIGFASALWGQCGIHFGPRAELVIDVVDPPPAHLLAVGCSDGMPASGGTVRVRIEGRVVEVETRQGEEPVEVATRLAEKVRQAGFSATVSPNARISRAALRSADVLVRSRAGQFVRLDTEGDVPVSNDPTLPVCLGEVTLEDGLEHFTDFDAASGTVEERALLKAFEDDDPSTLELFVIPTFARAGRIGESFIFGPGTSAQNAVILDRAGVRAGARSFTLAHELGHILLDMPGHPDDYGVDTPSSLMDADAADSTIFGPRRLSLEECERTMRQSGPDALVPLLEAWPLYAGEGEARPEQATTPSAPPQEATKSLEKAR